MMKPLLAFLLLAPSAALAQDHRELGPHVHGTGHLDIAIDGGSVEMMLHVPGADIVGFEHEAESEADKATLSQGIASLEKPLSLFVPTEAAGCSVTAAKAGLVTEDAHEHGTHDHHDADADHDAHDHAANHDDHVETHDDVHHHSEFEANYTLTCADPSALESIRFAYFDTFPNAQKLEIQLVTGKGGSAFEATRDAPVLDLSDAM